MPSRTSSPMLRRVRAFVHSRTKPASHSHCRGSARSRRRSGASARSSQRAARRNAVGFAHGSAWLTELCPPLAKLVSEAGSCPRSTTTTSKPWRFRKYAVVTPTTPAPMTTIFIRGSRALAGDASPQRLQRRFVSLVAFLDALRGDAQVAQQSVAQAVNPAVQRYRLVALPGVSHDGGARDVAYLLDDVQLAEPVGALVVVRDGADACVVPLGNVAHVPEPVVRQPDALAKQRRPDAAAAVVA